MSLQLEIDTSEADIFLKKLLGVVPDLTPKAVELATRIVFDEMRNTVPVKTGRLKNSIRFFVEGSEGVVSTESGYGKFVDQDTVAHTIRARYVKYLRIPVGDGFIFRKSVNHPGTTGHHFVAKTISNAKPKIVSSLTDMLRDEIGH